MLNFVLTMFMCIILSLLMSGSGVDSGIIVGFIFVVAPLNMIMFKLMNIEFLLEQRK